MRVAEPIEDAGPTAIDSGSTTPPPPPAWPADPFTVDTSCTAMTFAELATRFAAGATSANVPNFTVVSRTRASCNAITGCSAWVNPSPASIEQFNGIDTTNTMGKTHTLEGAGLMTLSLDTLDSPPRIKVQTWVAEPSTPNSIYVAFGGPIQGVAATSLVSTLVALETPGGDSPIIFTENYEGAPAGGYESEIAFTGRICEDGHYQFVTQLAAQIYPSDPDVTGSNNTNQIAYYGQL